MIFLAHFCMLKCRNFRKLPQSSNYQCRPWRRLFLPPQRRPAMQTITYHSHATARRGGTPPRPARGSTPTRRRKSSRASAAPPTPASQRRPETLSGSPANTPHTNFMEATTSVRQTAVFVVTGTTGWNCRFRQNLSRRSNNPQTQSIPRVFLSSKKDTTNKNISAWIRGLGTVST